MSATLGVGGAIGLPLSAWIVDGRDWHVLFWVAAALALVVLVSVWFLVPHVQHTTSGRFDAVGAVGLAVGLVAFLVGISKASTWGWTDARTLGAIVAGLVGARPVGRCTRSAATSRWSTCAPRRGCRCCSPTSRRSRSASG